jgi:hypothetical protein
MRRTNAVVRKSIKRSIKPVPVGWSKSRQVLMRWWQQRCPERRRPRRLHGDIASNYSLCHKTTGHVQPTQALLWIIGDIDSHNLNNAQPYGAWTVNIRLPVATSKALTALLKNGPYKTYTPP